MNHQYLDPSLTPPDRDPYDGDREERLLEDIGRSYRPDQVFSYTQLQEWATKEGYVLADTTITKTMTKEENINNIAQSRAGLYLGYRHQLKDWHAIYDEAMDAYAKEIATKALLHHGISENIAYYTVEQLLKENQ